MEHLGVRERIRTWAPRAPVAQSVGAAMRVLQPRVLILDYNDLDLNRLAVEKSIADTLLVLEQTRLLPVPSSQDRTALQTLVRETMRKAETLVQQHFGDIVSPDLIHRQTSATTDRLVAEIDDPGVYCLKQRPDAAQVDQMMMDLEGRLRGLRERAVTRLREVKEGMESRRGVEGQADDSAAILDRVQGAIISEAMEGILHSIRKATSPLKMQELNRNPDRILPGYSALVKAYVDRANFVGNRALQREVEEARRKMLIRDADR